MTYTNETDLFHIPHPAAGDVSSASEEAYRSQIPEWLTENLLRGLAGDDVDATIAQGFLVSDNGGLSVSVAAGRGFVDGIPIYASGATTKSGLTDDNTNYIYLKLTPTSDRDRGFTVEASLAGPPMGDAILIAVVTTVGGSITDIDNSPSGRAPRIPQTWGGIPQLRVVAAAGGDYSDPKTAIEACNAGDVVFICAATYTCASTITVPNDNIAILGADREAAVLNFTAADTDPCLNLNGKSGINIRHLSITAVAGKVAHGIRAIACSDLEVEDVTINGDGLVCFYALTSGDRNRLLRSRFLTAGVVALSIAAQTDMAIEGCEIIAGGASTYGASIASAIRARIVDTNIYMTATNATAPAINGVDWVGPLIVTGNSIIYDSPSSGSPPVAIQMKANTADSPRADVSGNRIVSVGPQGTGIKLFTAATYYIDEAKIQGNVITACATGIILSDARVRYALIHGNHLRSCTAKISDSGTSTTSADNVTT